MNFWDFDFMRRALLAGAMVGLAAPAIGVFLVQRRLSLLGDGIGHLAFTGVALGLLTSTSPTVTALVAAVAGAVLVEVLRSSKKASGDVALAILLYGGVAGGVFIASLSRTPAGGLFSYLFGSVLTVSDAELWSVVVLSVTVLGVIGFFAKQLFAVCLDEEMARASGLHVRGLNLLLAVTAAVTVVVAMRVVGLLLVAAMMVVPVAAVQPLFSSFRNVAAAGLVLGAVAGIAGLVIAFYIDAAPGPTVVLFSLGAFAISGFTAGVLRPAK